MSFFECCHYCKTPKRHPGCHDKCKDYLKQKALWEERKEIIRKETTLPPPAKTDYLNNPVWHPKRR